MKLERDTKAKKCDYCDEFAEYKLKDNGLYTYLCKSCYKNPIDAKKKINE